MPTAKDSGGCIRTNKKLHASPSGRGVPQSSSQRASRWYRKALPQAAMVTSFTQRTSYAQEVSRATCRPLLHHVIREEPLSGLSIVVVRNLAKVQVSVRFR